MVKFLQISINTNLFTLTRDTESDPTSHQRWLIIFNLKAKMLDFFLFSDILENFEMKIRGFEAILKKTLPIQPYPRIFTGIQLLSVSMCKSINLIKFTSTSNKSTFSKS